MMKSDYAKRLVVGCAVALAGIAGTAIGAVTDDAPTGRAAQVKWKADDALQQGMMNIRERVEGGIPRIRAGQFRDEHYDALGKEIESQITYIVTYCKLEPAADAALHDILGELSGGIDLMTAKTVDGQRTHGVSYVIAALDNYGRRFDHRAWTPVKVVP